MTELRDNPDPLQGHPSHEWPSTPYSDEARLPEPPMDTSCCIALLGGCTVGCQGWPPAMRPENQLAVRLRRAFPNQPFVIRNFGEAGETAGEIVQSGRLEQIRHLLSRIDVALLRYGIADRKKDGIPGCMENLGILCDRLQEAWVDICIIIETDMWVDYPEHYMWDRNARLAPLWEAIRQFATNKGYPVVDIFANMEAETKKGNWDLRMRGIPGDEGRYTILDSSFDDFYGADVAFFTNIHPNARCLGLIAGWEVAKLKKLYGKKLPGAKVPTQ